MQVVVILLHSILSDYHVLKNSTKLTFDPLVVAINLLMKTEEKLMIGHHPGSSGLRILLGSICGRVMHGRVISGGIRGSSVELSIQWMNAFINNSSLAFSSDEEIGCLKTSIGGK